MAQSEALNGSVMRLVIAALLGAAVAFFLLTYLIIPWVVDFLL